MNSIEEMKAVVRETYGEIAKQPVQGAGCCGTHSESASFNEDYSNVEGYVAEADLGLGCGMPVEFSRISAGDTVVDLGSGAGNDAFVARRIVGERGKVIGIDMTEPMIERARMNNDKLGYNNVEFRLGEIEKIPMASATADVVISNCVLNLVPDKEKAFAEMFRILKPGGHFCVSDIVLSGPVPDKLKAAAAMYAGCVSGALEKNDYLKKSAGAGFTHTSVKKERTIQLPDSLLAAYLSADEIASYRASGVQIMSITVTGEKPGPVKKPVLEEILAGSSSEKSCCGPECCN